MVICCTNRPKNLSSSIAQEVVRSFQRKGQIVNYFSLEELPKGFPDGDLYGERTMAFADIIQKQVLPFNKIVFVVPEYNASIPGIFKSFIDALPQPTLGNKKIALVGTATGRGGNSRGIDHLTNILHYLRVHVMPSKLFISSMLTLLQDGLIKDERVVLTMDTFTDEFIHF